MPGTPCASHPRYTAGCIDCQTIGRRYNKTRAAAIAAGTWRPPVPVAGVRAHINRLVRRRMTVREIAAAAHLIDGTVYDIRNGRSGNVVRGRVAAAILAVEAPRRAAEDIPPNGSRNLISALATRRMVQALAWMGHGITEQAEAAGVAKSALRGIAAASSPQLWCYPETERRVAVLYDKWWDVQGGGVRTRRAAARNGWHGPLAWDDDTLADPKAKPGQAPRRTSRTARSDASVQGALAGDLPVSDLTTVERVEVVTKLVARGWVDERIGEWLRWGDTPDQWRDNAFKCRRDHNIPAAPRRLREMAIEDGHQRARYLAGTAA